MMPQGNNFTAPGALCVARQTKLLRACSTALALVALILIPRPNVQAQDAPAPPGTQTNSQTAAQTTSPVAETIAPPRAAPHRFWDRENDFLFAGVGAARALDYSSTLYMRRRGINEVFLDNQIVDNHAEFAAIEAGATAASIGLSYLFHRTGHHRLERWTSIVHIGVATGGAIRNYALPSIH